MTLWEWQSAVTGYSEAHGGKSSGGAKEMSEDRLKELGIEGF